METIYCILELNENYTRVSITYWNRHTNYTLEHCLCMQPTLYPIEQLVCEDTV